MEKFAGIDWASAEHALCVVDEQGRRLRERLVSHEEAGIAALCRELADLEVERVAIERPDGILVDRLLETGIEVIAVHPNQAKAARERYSVARGKSDRFDAFVLAELARTDAHRLRAIRPDSDETKALRALTRTREDLVGVRVELANQLRAQLEAFWPGALVFADVDSPISLAFLERYPGPADTRGLGPRRSRNSGAKICPSGCAASAPRIWEVSSEISVTIGLRAATKPSTPTRRASASRSPARHPWAREVYRRARDRGQDHPHAIRTLGRAWLRVLWRCWQNRAPYEPALHGNFQRLQPVGG